jgi:glutamyl/glutaminyl-tRNA synthetase
MKVRFAPSPTGSPDIDNAIVDAPSVSLPDGRPTLVRFRELREGAHGAGEEHFLDARAAKSIIRELKAVGGNLRAVRRALTGRESGPELWSVIAALPREETLRRIDGAL